MYNIELNNNKTGPTVQEAAGKKSPHVRISHLSYQCIFSSLKRVEFVKYFLSELDKNVQRETVELIKLSSV